MWQPGKVEGWSVGTIGWLYKARCAHRWSLRTGEPWEGHLFLIIKALEARASRIQKVLLTVWLQWRLNQWQAPGDGVEEWKDGYFPVPSLPSRRGLAASLLWRPPPFRTAATLSRCRYPPYLSLGSLHLLTAPHFCFLWDPEELLVCFL